MKRLANVSDLFSPVADDEYYLSKLGLTPPFRGKRLGRLLVDRYIEEGVKRGHMRYRLDVQVNNEAAISCYRSAGFEICQRTESKDGKWNTDKVAPWRGLLDTTSKVDECEDYQAKNEQAEEYPERSILPAMPVRRRPKLKTW